MCSVIERYVRDCKLLKRALEQVISDFQFVHHQHGTIRYAVDFSEIYAYAFPEKTAKEFSLSLIDEPDEANIRVSELRQRLALNRLFEGTEKVILLEPYITELRAFWARFQQQQVQSFVDQMPKLLKISADPKFKELSDIAIQAEQNAQPLSQADLKKIADYFEEQGEELLYCLALRDRDPISRITRLFQHDRFEDLDALVDVEGLESDRTIDELYERLLARRGEEAKNTDTPTASNLDAIAMALLKVANQVLRSKKIKLLLVTRSEAMHDVFNQISWQDLDDPNQVHPSNETDKFLRHPRIFSIYSVLDSHDPEEVLHLLEERLKTVEAFLAPIDSEGLSEFSSAQNQAHIRNCLTQIQRDWKSTKSLEETLDGAADIEKLSTHPATQQQDDKNIQRVFQLLNNRQELKEYIFDRLKDLTKALEQKHGFLSVVFPKQQALDAIEAEAHENIYILKAPSDVPYSLEFYSDAAKQLLSVFKAGEDYSLNQIFQFVEQGFREEPNYEYFLAIACVWGTLGWWKQAETYCESAVELAKAEDIPTHEGHFFLAICLRKSTDGLSFDQQLNRCLESIKHLNLAIEQKQKYLKKSDPRYLKEKGLEILRLHIDFSGKSKEATQAIKTAQKSLKDNLSPEKGLELLDLAERLTDDPLLKIQILNTRLFYYVEKRLQENHRIKNEKLIEQQYDRLLASLQSQEKDESKWHPPVLDTLAWTAWNLYASGIDSAKQRAVEWLKLALESDKPTTRRERQIIEQHRRRILEMG